MKKMIALLMLTLSASAAMAQHHGYGHRNLHGHQGHHGHYARGHVGGGWGWTVPAAIGGLSNRITALCKIQRVRHGQKF